MLVDLRRVNCVCGVAVDLHRVNCVCGVVVDLHRVNCVCGVVVDLHRVNCVCGVVVDLHRVSCVCGVLVLNSCICFSLCLLSRQTPVVNSENTFAIGIIVCRRQTPLNTITFEKY